MESEHILYRKLNQFIRKYYTNQLIRGALATLGLMAGLYVVFVLLEGLARFDTMVRTIMFFLYLFVFAVALIGWIALPVASLLKFRKRLTYIRAAEVIGNHFAGIQDKLVNALQLIEQKHKEIPEYSLLGASIDQKTDQLKLFSFTQVIHYKNNLKYLKYVIPPLSVILLALLFAPWLISEPTQRIVDYNTMYLKPFPFQIKIVNPELFTFQQEDFPLQVYVTGEVIPSEFYIESGNVTYRMQKNSSTDFSYLFRALQKDTEFRIRADRFRSEKYVIRVYPRPTILHFTVDLTYPAYTGRQHEQIENTGDLVVPAGTVIRWRWFTKDVDEIRFAIDNRVIPLKREKSNVFSHTYTGYSTGSYSVRPVNQYTPEGDSLGYKIIAIADAYPTIFTEVFSDSMLPSNLFFNGTIRDDYGFTRLEFRYEIHESSDTVPKKTQTSEITLNEDSKEELFYFMIDLDTCELQAGERMLYYFVVWDNDGILGPKSTRSEIRELRTLTLDEIKAVATGQEKAIKTDLGKSIEEAKRVEKTIEDLKRRLVEKNEINWQEKKQIEELIRKNEQILENIEKIKENNRNNLETEEKLMQVGQSILEKQKRLQELMDELMTDELRKTIQELKDLLNQVDKKKLTELMEKMKLSSRELEEQLDRNLELFKQIEYEKKVEEVVRELREIADGQDKLADQIEQNEKISEGNKEKQEALNTAFDSVQKQLKSLQEMEQNLENPLGIEKTAEKQDSIHQSLREAAEELNQNHGKKALQKQRQGARQMQGLAAQLEAMQAAAEQEQYAEDARQIRQILENLLNSSFEQEELISKTKQINRNDPKFQEIIVQQSEMNGKLQSAKDSLEAIGRRQFLLQPVIARQLNAVNQNIRETVDALTSRNMVLAMTRQQFTMTALNNLAVLLDEAMQQMNQNMNMSMQGKNSRMCQNPSMGKGKQSIKNIRSLQEQLSRQMEQIRKGLEEGRKNEGMKQQTGQQGMNEKIARLAAEQEAIRNELSKLQQSLKEQGISDHGENETIQDMEKNERDLINKNITRETLLRQQRILTRLLESERAEQIREQQEKREAEEVKNRKYSNPDQNLEYNKYTKGESEMLKLSTLPVNRFYKSKANSYMIQIMK